MIHELYAVMAFVSALIISILCYKTFSVKYLNTLKKPFIKLFNISIVFCLIDSLWGIFASKVFVENTLLLTIFSYAFHAGATFTTYYWFRFNLNFMNNKVTKNLFIKLLSDLILVVAAVLILLNISYDTVFYISSDCGYYTGKYRRILFCLQYCLFFIMFFVSLISKFKETDKVKCSIIKISLSYSVIPLIAGVFQLIYPDMPVYSLGFMFCCLILYIFVITAENERLIVAEQKTKALVEYQKMLQRNYSIISSLAGNYDFVCIVNGKENKIQPLNCSGIFADFVSKEKEFIDSKDFDFMLNSIIAKNKIRDFIQSVNRELITTAVLKGERVSIEFETYYKHKKSHYRLSIASDKEDTNNFLFGFKNMETEFVMRQEIEKQKNYITNLEAQNEIAVLMASIDGLTGLLNKISYIQKVESYVNEHTSQNCALLFFDMDHFKSINDVFGHEKGDDALKEMAAKLKPLFRSNELIARMGGDEFSIFLPDISLEIVEQRVALMNERLKAVYQDENATIKTSASIGGVYCKDKLLSYLEMYKIADEATYEVKNNGRDGHNIKVV